VTQKTAASTKEIASAGEELNAQAATLCALVKELIRCVTRQEGLGTSG
jgi:methyl-accepting chemotaxis protein